MANSRASVVFVVDDDSTVRDAIATLLASVDLQAITFGSAAAFLEHPKSDVPACLVLDVQLPDINGLDLQSRVDAGILPPIVFITGHGDIPSSVRAIKAGAVDFLTKPFLDSDLLRAIATALARSAEEHHQRDALADLRQRLSTLTPREREALPLIASGLLNKQAAVELGISDVTLQIHRSNIMKKMGADSFADLVRMAAALELPITRSRHPHK